VALELSKESAGIDCFWLGTRDAVLGRAHGQVRQSGCGTKAVAMTPIRKFLTPLSLALAVTLTAGFGFAKSDAVRYSVRTAASGIEAGAARIRVKASPTVLTSVVTDYGHGGEFISRFEKVRVIGRSGENVDVYLQVPILKGAAKIWAVVRFGAPKDVGTERVIEGRMIKGNVERLDAKWRIIPVDAQTSELHLQMLIVPKFPVPGSLVTGEVAYAADKAVVDVRAAAEKKR
jgi:ribosome-associated toxin RatA of RatAB toxin-antitoxin module